jgi:hypothetical protein
VTNTTKTTKDDKNDKLKDQYENKNPRDEPKVDPARKGEAPQEKPGPAIEIDEGEHHDPGPLMRSATVQTKRKAAREGEIEEPRPPENATAGQAMEYLTKGDTSVLKTMSADAVASVRPMFKQWANGEQDRLKAEYDRVYNAILAEMHDKGVVY